MLRYSWYINQTTTRQVKTKLLPWTQEQSFEFYNVGGVPLCQQIWQGKHIGPAKSTVPHHFPPATIC